MDRAWTSQDPGARTAGGAQADRRATCVTSSAWLRATAAPTRPVVPLMGHAMTSRDPGAKMDGGARVDRLAVRVTCVINSA